jgi:hypothetical protein
MRAAHFVAQPQRADFMKKIILLVLILTSPVFAVKEYYSLTRSIRSLGMGGAFYGLSNDEYALFYNPAGLSLYTGEAGGMLRINAQAAPDSLSAFKTLSDLTKSSNTISRTVDALQKYQGKPLYAGAGLLPFFHMKNFGVALLLADTKTDLAILGKELDTSVDLTAISDSGLVVGYGRSIPGLEDLHVGINAKFIFRAGGKKVFSVLDIAQNRSVNLSPKDLGGAGAGVDFDLGSTYELHGLPWGIANRISLSLNNLVASSFTISRTGGRPPQLTRMASLGYYTVFEGWEFIDNFHVLLDLAEFNLGGESDTDYGARTGSIWKHVNIGVEMPMSFFALRAGLHQGYLTAGFGLNLTYVKLDFATYEEELSHSGPGRLGSRRFALSLALGMGSPPIPVMSATREIPVESGKKQEGISDKIEEKKDGSKIDPNLEIKDDPKPAPKPKTEKRNPQSGEVDQTNSPNENP